MIQLEEINRIRSKLGNDIDARKTLSARYRKFYNTLHGISLDQAQSMQLLLERLLLYYQTQSLLYRWLQRMSL